MAYKLTLLNLTKKIRGYTRPFKVLHPSSLAWSFRQYYAVIPDLLERYAEAAWLGRLDSHTRPKLLIMLLRR